MKLNFNIDYRTSWGEWLYIVGTCPALGGGNEEAARRLEMDGVGRWTFEIDAS